jgi:NADPH:quinone reductase
MKAILCTHHGLPEELRFAEIPDPHPATGEVVIAAHACAVNFPDVLIIQDKYQFKPELPFSPGGEVAGYISAVGEGVSHLAVGQRVLALCGWGGFAEKVKVKADRVFPIPDELGFTAAASTLYTFGTAYHGLKDRANIQPGETLLVLGASGGVGLAAVELGKLMGARVIAAASASDKLEICSKKGADFLINYEEEDLKDKIKTLTEGKGVDVVMDVVGGKYAEPALRGMAWNGRYLVVGFASGDIPKLPFNLALLKGCSVMGVFWGRFSTEEPKKNFQNISELVQLLLSGQIQQHIYKTYHLAQAPQALRDMLDRKVVGKAMIQISELAEESKPIGTKHSEPDLQAGKELGFSDWTTVTQAQIQKFAEATDDYQWIHVDPEKAAKLLPGGKTLAHGFLTLSLMPKLLYQLLPLEGVEMALNYGTNQVRFPAPVHAGDRVRLTATLLKTEFDASQQGKLFVRATMFAEGREKPVCVADLITLIRR